ncbi:hypothetical protein A0H81_14196 [Grifola frondosa]|uniref:YCII-related domain-containing protein n=1 Tax=Grifola frondosa TaxID=5627 RepID=A0A1C7LM98_GRIFR|nr:hypothetical protein A0H81_14196 [Grifola frondosa]
MSSASATKQFFFVYAPDLPGAAQRRFAFAGAHQAKNAPLLESGFIRVGGGLLKPDVTADTPNVMGNIVGSFLLIQAENIDVVKKTLQDDIYYTSGEVWDVDKLVILPALVGTPVP